MGGGCLEVIKDRYDLVKQYFQIDKANQRTRERIQNMRLTFYSQNMTTRMCSSDEQLYTVGFRLETKVVDFVDYATELENRIKRNNKKKRYLSDYLNTLPPEQKEYLLQRYVYKTHVSIQEEIEIAVIEEINEIEEAINRMHGFPLEPKILSKETDEHTEVSDLLALLGVVRE